jgi:hypothetical protein
MSADPRFEIEPTDQTQAERKRSAWTTCLIGCLVVLGVILVVAVIFAIWVARNWRGWTAGVATEVANQAIDSSEMPAGEKQEMKAQVKRLTDAFGDGRLSLEKTAQIVEKIVQSPLMPAMIVMAADKQYLEKSGLSAEEKAEGRKTLLRFSRGMIDQKISEEKVDGVLAHVADKKPDGNWEFRQQVSDADLRAALAEAKLQADEAGISEEPPEFDPSDEFKKIIDEALGEAGAAIEPEAPTLEPPMADTPATQAPTTETPPAEAPAK